MARSVKKARTDPTATSRRRRLAVVGLIIFVIADIILVAWAATASRTPHESTSAATTSRPTASATKSATPTPTPTPTATTAPVADAVAPTRLLAVLDNNTAWRAATGPCPATPAVAEITTDGGANWKQSDASGPTGASSLIRLTVQSGTQASAIALTAQGCSPEFIRTYVAGDNWATYADQLPGAWYANPGTGGTVHSPTGDVPAPCPAVVGLAVSAGSNAAVLCANHDVYRTTDNGASWGSAQNVPAAVAITALDSGYVVASVGAEGCAGTSIAGIDGGNGGPGALACVGSGQPAAGTVAIAAGTGTVWLWAGDALARSTDGGKTWS
jgi:hypothetical protein